MNLSMYQAAVPVCMRMFRNLVSILEKGNAHAEQRGIEPSVLLNARLFPDMFPLVRQVQVATDIGKRGAERLAGDDVTFVDAPGEPPPRQVRIAPRSQANLS